MRVTRHAPDGLGLVAEQPGELGPRAFRGGGLRRDIGPGTRGEVIAEIRPGLVADLFGDRFAAFLGNVLIEVDAHAAHMQFGAAAGAFITARQRQGQGRQIGAALPAD